MKKLIVLSLLALTSFLGINAQSQIVSQLSDAVTDLTGSFMDNPYHHSNTVKIYENTTKFNSLIKEMLEQAPFGSTDYYQLKNMQKILKGLEHITAGVNDRYPASVDAEDFEALNSIFNAFGWTWSVLSSTPDIILYEYQKDGFKMVLAKNVRPKLNGGDYNAVSYQCYAKSRYSKKDEMFTGRVVFGGNYQFVNCGDDTVSYVKITKVTSKRGTNF